MSCNWDIIKHILKVVTFYIYCESNSVLIIYCGDIKTRLRYSRISRLKYFKKNIVFADVSQKVHLQSIREWGEAIYIIILYLGNVKQSLFQCVHATFILSSVYSFVNHCIFNLKSAFILLELKHDIICKP